jgi:hypothetical protein
MIMFGPSLKSVPGCLVSIVPMLIGEPVALTPGLGPHEEVLPDPVLALVVPLVLELVALDAPLAPVLALLVLLLLLPQPASSIAAPTSMASAMPARVRKRSAW